METFINLRMKNLEIKSTFFTQIRQRFYQISSFITSLLPEPLLLLLLAHKASAGSGCGDITTSLSTVSLELDDDEVDSLSDTASISEGTLMSPKYSLLLSLSVLFVVFKETSAGCGCEFTGSSSDVESESDDEIASILYVFVPLPSSRITGDTLTRRCCSRRG